MALVAGRYELGQVLGAGGFASVFRAHDLVAAREVALKLIPADGIDERQLERFRHEALALSRLRSPHVARVFDFGRDAEVGLFLVMELIDGVALEPQAIGRPLLPHEVLRVARGVLDALADAHGAGIVHRDVKPSNVLLPRGRKTRFDEVRVLDFGIARSVRRATVDESLGKRDTEDGHVLGTRAYMAPEQLAGAEAAPSVDVYAAGLVLFQLLGVGPLFLDVSDQIAARRAREVELGARVPPPLGPLLEGMLARDPRRRFRDAAAALAAIGDLETAPVAIESLFEPESGSAAWKKARALEESGQTPAFRRLSRLDADASTALKDALRALDLAMIDALARRERGAEMGRVARAVALSLRLELDAAALLLEPLAPSSAMARAFGQTLVAARARKVTRARVEHDRTDVWVDEIDPELAAMLSAVAVAMTTREDAARNESRCQRARARIADASSPAARTAEMARIAAGCVHGTVPTSTGLAQMLALAAKEPTPPGSFHVLVRALLLGVAGFRGDEHLARRELERAVKIGIESGATLFEARAIVAWGGMLVEIPSKIDQGIAILERATTLLAHGDAPSLEHIAEHNRGAALIIQGRYAEAAEHLRRARAAAAGELSIEHEVLACTNEAFAHVFRGAYEPATAALHELSEKRLAEVSARSAAFGHLARSLYALLFQSVDAALVELRRAMARAEEADADGGDATLLAELLAILYASARGEPVDLLPRAAELEKLAQDHGFASFYWLENLRSAVEQVRDERLRTPLEETLSRLLLLLGPIAQSAR